MDAQVRTVLGRVSINFNVHVSIAELLVPSTSEQQSAPLFSTATHEEDTLFVRFVVVVVVVVV